MSIQTMSGHKRDEDAIEDDKNQMRNLKQEWIDATMRIFIKSTSQNKEHEFVGAEESVNEMLQQKWDMLCAEDGSYDDLPQSVYMQKWVKEYRLTSLNAGKL